MGTFRSFQHQQLSRKPVCCSAFRLGQYTYCERASPRHRMPSPLSIKEAMCKSFYFMGGNLTMKWAVKQAIRYRNVFVHC